MKLKPLLAPNEHWHEVLGSVTQVPQAAVILPASGGTWLRNLFPGLWNLARRLVLIDGQSVVVYSIDMTGSAVRGEKWSGRKADLRVKDYLGKRVARITPRERGDGPTLQVDGKDSVARLLNAFEGS